MPEASVFLDVDSIPAGVNFKQHVRQRIADSDVVIVLIGDEWLRSRDGRERIQEIGDNVRIEIEEALTADVRMLPVLVERAHMPPVSALPKAVSPLAEINALEIHAKSSNQDIETLIGLLAGPGALPRARNTERTTGESVHGDRPGQALELPQKITERWQRVNVPPMSRTDLVGLIAKLRDRGWYEHEIEQVVKRSRHRPPRKPPKPINQGWLDTTVPVMSAHQVRSLITDLRQRGWTTDEIRQRVLPLVPERRIDERPSKITAYFLEERALFLPRDQGQEVAELMLKRGWNYGDVEKFIPQAVMA